MINTGTFKRTYFQAAKFLEFLSIANQRVVSWLCPCLFVNFTFFSALHRGERSISGRVQHLLPEICRGSQPKVGMDPVGGVPGRYQLLRQPPYVHDRAFDGRWRGGYLVQSLQHG